MSSPTIRVTCHGAAGTVTGSKFLVEADKTSILVDCGVFQGNKELRLRNWQAPSFDAKALAAVVLTHAHIDHTGYLPILVKQGFRGPIYCTKATSGFLALLLPDAAKLQEEEANYANAQGTSKHSPAKPLFTLQDARQALGQLQEMPRNQTTKLAPHLAVTPSCAGHILGATSLSLDCHSKRITFSGDIGRYDTPILPDPQPVQLGDLLMCESTYGDREHSVTDPKEELAKVIVAALERKGAVLIPAFALGRTQTLLYYLAELEREGKIPELPVYLDSPMAVDATKIYKAFRHDFDEEASELIEAGEKPLATAQTKLCKSVQESKALNHLSGSRIIISASGMVTGGRILHHMQRLLPLENTTVLLVGYQAAGTRGRTIQSGSKKVKIFGQMIPIRAQIETISGLSAHADRNELLRWLKSSKGTPGLTKTIHGEPHAAESFAQLLQHELNWQASAASDGEVVEV